MPRLLHHISVRYPLYAFKLIKTPVSRLLRANVNEHIYHFVYYLARRICY